MKSILRLIALVAIGGMLSSGTVHAQQATKKLRVGVIPIYDTLPVYVAREKGFFASEGIDAEIIPTSGGAVAIPAMEGGSLDVVYSDVGSIFRATERGLKVRIVAPAGTVNLHPTKDGARLLSAKTGSVKELKDIVGKRVAVNLLRNITHLYLIAGLENRGIPLGSYTVVEIPYSQMPDALLNGQVDMVNEVDPFATILIRSGKVHDFGSGSYGVHPNLRIAAYVASQRLVTENPEILRKFQAAYAKAADFVMANKDMHGDWQVKYFRLKPELKDVIPPYGVYQDTDLGKDFQASLIKTKDLMLKYKFLDKNLDPTALIFR